MSLHFTAIVLLKEPWLPDAKALAELIGIRFDGLGTVEVVDSVPEEGLVVLDVDGRLIAIERLEGRMPYDPLGAEIQPERGWDASAAIEAHAAHLRVADLEEPPDRETARRSAALVTGLAGVLARMGKALGAYYPHSGVLLAEHDALRATHMVQVGVSPIEAWVSFYLLGPRDEDESTPNGACTHGLEPLIGRELEIAPQPFSPRRALDRAYGMAWQALDGEDGIADGATLRDPEGNVIAHVRAVPHWLRKGVPALVLAGPTAVVDLKRLKLKRGTDPAVLHVAPPPAPAAAAGQEEGSADAAHA